MIHRYISTLLLPEFISLPAVPVNLLLQVKLGQRERVSQIDAQQMNLLYKKQCEEGVGGGGGGDGGDGGEV